MRIKITKRTGHAYLTSDGFCLRIPDNIINNNENLTLVLEYEDPYIEIYSGLDIELEPIHKQLLKLKDK